MRYARIENGICNTNLPNVGVMKNGNTVSGYDKLSHEELMSEGWKEFVEVKPTFNKETQYLQFSGYGNGEKITAEYVVVDKPIEVYIELAPTTDERIDQLEEMIIDLSIMIGGV